MAQVGDSAQSYFFNETFSPMGRFYIDCMRFLVDAFDFVLYFYRPSLKK